MKSLLFVLLLSLGCKAEETQFFYAPTPAILTGIIDHEAKAGNSAPDGWTLRLSRPVTVNPNPGDQGGALATDVKKVRLVGSADLLRAAAGNKASVTCYGTLRQATGPKDSRPVVMEVTAYQPARPPIREIVRSPDGKVFVAWADQDLGPPLGTIRSIFLRYANDQDTLFSVVSSPRDTKTAWNPASSRCVIADAPDNGGPRTWLIVRPSPDAWEWQSRVIEPFRELEREFRQSDPQVHHLFRPSILKIEWLSDTKVRFRAFCNTGIYWITMDTDHPDPKPTAEKLSDRWLEE